MVTAALEAATRQMGLLVGMRRDQAMFGETTWVHHYSRSLEKFAQKSRTWKTNSGELLPGQSLEQASKSYDVTTFMHRSVGWKHDSTAVRYGCQVRALLREVTGEETFFRHGDFWYRNPEFGRPISDPAKRGRYGRPNPPNFRYNDGNPYHYHGSHARHKRLRGNTQ